jgi:threonylcarbamoyladenosine tRNA methylthiotransferase MtaB
VTRTVGFATLGCRLNQVDSQEIQAELEAQGFRTVPADQPADVVVVNTCTVTARAELSDRQAIYRARRLNPHARIVVTGCWAQTDPQAVARQAGVDLIVGNADKSRLPFLVDRLLAQPAAPAPAIEVSDIAGQRRLEPATPPRGVGRSRAFVKVQDGCQHRCAFCIVPRARGVSRSRALEAVAVQVEALVAGGYCEVTLTGVDLGHYGADLVPRTTLTALLRRLVEIRGLRWIRLSSVLPAYFTPELLEIVTGSARIAPHLHIPLQSGSDRVLRRMRRPYSVAIYHRLIERLAGAIPELGLGADVIVGFPGEDEADFVQTRTLVQALPFTYLHVFSYSDRPGTEAIGLDNHVDRSVVAGRSRQLRALGAAKSLAFRRRLVGSVRDALILETRDRASAGLVGLTDNYVEVVLDGPDVLMRRLLPVQIDAVEGPRTLGVLAHDRLAGAVA